MNKLFFVLIIFLSVESMATKARVQALADSFHLSDPQTVYSKPIDLISLPNFFEIESGVTASSNVLNGAEAMISYGFSENQRFALSLGHQNESVAESRNLINTLGGAAFEMQQNPIHLFYSFEESLYAYALGAMYSRKNDKLSDRSENSVGLTGSIELGSLQVISAYNFVNTAESVGGKKFDGGGYWQTTLSYLLENTTIELVYQTSRAKMTSPSGENELHVKNVISLGLADTSLRDGSDFFWGAQIVSTVINCKISLSFGCDKVFTRTVLPAWFGVETPISDWLTFRGSVKQSFVVSVTKDEFGYPASVVNGGTGAVTNFASGENDTVVSSGLGLKFKSLTIDGTISTATTQTLDSSNFLSQVGMSYYF